MTTINTPAIATPAVTIVNEQPVTTSQNIAEYFGRRHNDVLKAIRNLISEIPEEDRLRNFAETVVMRKNPSGGGDIASKCYQITKDGFTLLAMGFTGKKAMQFKLAYIQAFNAMEAELSQPKPQPKPYIAKTKIKGLVKGGLTAEQCDIIKSMISGYQQGYEPKEQAKIAMACWGALKRKFGCSYKQIPTEQFSEAVSLITRLFADPTDAPAEPALLPTEAAPQLESKPIAETIHPKAPAFPASGGPIQMMVKVPVRGLLAVGYMSKTIFNLTADLPDIPALETSVYGTSDAITKNWHFCHQINRESHLEGGAEKFITGFDSRYMQNETGDYRPIPSNPEGARLNLEQGLYQISFWAWAGIDSSDMMITPHPEKDALFLSKLAA